MGDSAARLADMYGRVDAILNALDFDGLFAGFHKYRFALYNSEEICLDGAVMPYEDGFRGNTSMLYDGEHIAIWNVELDPVDDMDMLACDLVHEMFHCHQNANHEARFPSDLALLRYPDDMDNFTRKYNENRYLASACARRDAASFKRFAALRNQRLAAYPDMVRQELRVETIEGMAEYVGLKALRAIDGEKFALAVKRHLDKLTARSGLLFDVRRISYYTGAVYFLCLELFGRAIHNDFGSGLTAYEQNPIRTDGTAADVSAYDFIAREYAALAGEREAAIAGHIARARYVAADARICGYDPMNMFRVQNRVYCRHFVCLDEQGRVSSVNGPVVLELAEGSDCDVKGYYQLA